VKSFVTASHVFHRKLLVKKAGYFRATAVFDGVESNALDLNVPDK
jgi:hypothetical protein